MGICISRPPALALAPNLYLPALAANLYLPNVALNFYLPALVPKMYLPPRPGYCPRFVFTSTVQDFTTTAATSH